MLVKADSPEDAKEFAESGYDFYREESLFEVEEVLNSEEE